MQRRRHRERPRATIDDDVDLGNVERHVAVDAVAYAGGANVSLSRGREHKQRDCDEEQPAETEHSPVNRHEQRAL
jgi:hypothetical protein